MGRMIKRVLPVAVGVAGVAVLVGGGAASAAAGRAESAAPTVPLSATCEDSDLPPHTGFEIGPACVSTQFGEVAAAEDNPQLLIVDAPDEVTAGQPFTIKVSTRNLVRDRFLAAAQGGYYVERSRLDENGLVRGHFHTACRVLADPTQAPAPERNAVFVATEDNGGGAAPDTVTVNIPGLPTAGRAQCATWAGDGSHRMPLMQFANQIPAFDSVRIEVTGKEASRTPSSPGQPAGDRAGQGDSTGQRGGAERPVGAAQPADGGQPGSAGDRAGQRGGAERPAGAAQPADSGQPGNAGDRAGR